jgi:high affinity Mn2+ porin
MAKYQTSTAILLMNPPEPNAGSGFNIPPAARSYCHKYGFGLNWEQELAKNIGVFSRIGWNDGQEEAWTFTDVNWTVSLGISINGIAWHRHDDTFGFAAIISGASLSNQNFMEAGGTDMLEGDGALNYDPEKVIETFYNFRILKPIHLTVDYQFVDNPAFNRDRGPVSIFGARLHWEL